MVMHMVHLHYESGEIKRFVIISRGSKFNESVTANTEIFSSYISFKYYPVLVRIYACFDTAGVLTLGTKVIEKLLAIIVFSTLVPQYIVHNIGPLPVLISSI